MGFHPYLRSTDTREQFKRIALIAGYSSVHSAGDASMIDFDWRRAVQMGLVTYFLTYILMHMEKEGRA